MRLLAVDPMIKNNDHFKRLCKVLNFLLEEQMERTAMSEKWGGEVQIQALSIASFRRIYSYVLFDNNLKIDTLFHPISLHKNWSIDLMKEL